MALLSLENIQKEYRGNAGVTAAVRGVSLEIAEQATVGLVGESGSGKSTLGRIVGLLEDPTAGRLVYRGQALGRAPWRQPTLRRDIQLIFQDPVSSLNPRWTVRQILSEPFRLQYNALYRDRSQLEDRIRELLHDVRLSEDLLMEKPGNLSGGQCQRISLARTMALKPSLVVLDESLSALDMSTKASMVALLKSLQESHGMAYLFISHDLGLVQAIAQEIYVLKDGAVVEHGPTASLLQSTRDPYLTELKQTVLRIGDFRWNAAQEEG